MIDAVYDCWIDEGDTPEIRAQKKSRFENIRANMEFVGVQTEKISINGSLSGEYRITEETLFERMVTRGYRNTLDKLENKISGLSVQTGVYSVSPITAKIGKKEGLSVDQRFNVYENVLRKDKIVQVRKGIVRVGARITDNRKVTDGNTKPSEFYQISGMRIEPGMTLKQHNDVGMSLIGGYGYSSNQQGQVQLRAEQLLARLLPIQTPGWYLYLEGEIESGSYEAPMLKKKDDFTFLRGGGGFGKHYYPLRNLQTSPYGGLGYEYVGYGTDYTVESWYLKAGINFMLNIYYPFQLVGGGYAYGLSSQLKNSSDDSEVKNSEGKGYSDYFKGRNPYGAVGFVGVRISF
jgi:hypothetical protein